MQPSTLTTLADRFGSDKGNQKHLYTPFYEQFFSPLKYEFVSLLELGLCIKEDSSQLPSIQMWLHYFPLGNIYGFDCKDFSSFKHPRFTFIHGDLSGMGLDKVHSLNTTFDIVIDDASHASFHQQHAFVSLFPLLKPGGYYCIEDLHFQPTHYEISLPQVPLTKEIFKSPATINSTYLFNKEFSALSSQINKISFLEQRNQTKLLIIEKKRL